MKITKVITWFILFGFLIGMSIGIILVKRQFPKEVQLGFERYSQILDRDTEMTINNRTYKCIAI